MKVFDDYLNKEVDIQEDVTIENGKEIILEDPKEIKDAMQSD